MKSAHSLREITTAINRDLLAQFVEEHSNQWGFTHDEDVKVILEGLPETIPMTFKFKKEQEAKVITHNEAT